MTALTPEAVAKMRDLHERALEVLVAEDTLVDVSDLMGELIVAQAQILDAIDGQQRRDEAIAELIAAGELIAERHSVFDFPAGTLARYEAAVAALRRPTDPPTDKENPMANEPELQRRIDRAQAQHQEILAARDRQDQEAAEAVAEDNARPKSAWQ